MPFKDPEKQKAYFKEYRKKNAIQINLNNQKYVKKNKEKINERYNNCSSTRIYNWKRQGIKSDNYENLYLKYKNTNNCELCHCELKGRGTFKKCVDHCHDTGYVRNIVCGTCNNKLPIIERLHTKVLLELHRYFILHN